MVEAQEGTLPASAKAGGLLLAAFQAGKTEAIQWAEVTVDGLVVTVASDAMKAPLNGRSGVRLPVSYEEAIAICAALGCVSPTLRICDAMFAQAKAQLGAIPLVHTAADARQMTTVDFVLRFHDACEKQLAGQNLEPGALRFGAWKLWILHPRLVEKGAVNYGFWNKGTRPPTVIQTPGAQHDPQHYDYSQLLVPVKRMARKADTGEAVDLLDVIATHDKVPARYLDPYRVTKPVQA